jgi:hypothetical protein
MRACAASFSQRRRRSTIGRVSSDSPTCIVFVTRSAKARQAEREGGRKGGEGGVKVGTMTMAGGLDITPYRPMMCHDEYCKQVRVLTYVP